MRSSFEDGSQEPSNAAGPSGSDAIEAKHTGDTGDDGKTGSIGPGESEQGVRREDDAKRGDGSDKSPVTDTLRILYVLTLKRVIPPESSACVESE
ncbi:hypothetical protein BDW22DRAFT_1433735 [Trametopsis cervina]|nr:hypothetical protein BDW22DRAFT_1433735 [Trametopsis cervina]